MVEETETNNQKQTKDNKITKARSRVMSNTPALFGNPTASKGKLIEECIIHCQKKGFGDAKTRIKSRIL